MDAKSKKQFWDMTIQAPIVEKAIAYVDKGNALDLGSGEGRNAFYLSENGFNVVAVDNEPAAIESIKLQNKKSLHQITAIQSDVLEYETNQTFDYIVCNMVLHFLTSKSQVLAMVTKMHNMTNVSGVNVIGVYTDKNEPNKRPYLFKTNDRWQCRYRKNDYRLSPRGKTGS